MKWNYIVIMVMLVSASMIGGAMAAGNMTDEQKTLYFNLIWANEFAYREQEFYINELLAIPNRTPAQEADLQARYQAQNQTRAYIIKTAAYIKANSDIKNIKKAAQFLTRTNWFPPRITEMQGKIDQNEAEWQQYLIDREKRRVEIEEWILQMNPPQADIDAAWADWNNVYTASYYWYQRYQTIYTWNRDLLIQLQSADKSVWDDIL